MRLSFGDDLLLIPIPCQALPAVAVREVGHVACHRRAAAEVHILHRLLAGPHALEQVQEVVFRAFALLRERNRLALGLPVWVQP